MDQLISTFHIDIKLLLAQAVNFGLVVFVLYRFAYKPLLKNMNDRNAVINKGLEDAKKAQEELEKAHQRREEKIRQAKEDARQIIEDAQKQAEKNREDIVNRSKEETEKIVAKAKQQIATEKERMIKEVRQDVSGLVVLATEKILQSKIDREKDHELAEEFIAQIGRNNDTSSAQRDGHVAGNSNFQS